MLESESGPAKCKGCGFSTPVELDSIALGGLLEEARRNGLGPAPALGPSRDLQPHALRARRSLPELEAPQGPPAPPLSPPHRPPELAMRSPPSLEDPRSSLPPPRKEDRRDLPSDVLEKEKKDRRRELRPRGELLR